MTPLPFDKAQRDELLKRRREALTRYEAALDRGAQYDPWSQGEAIALAEADRRLQAASLAESEYFQRLPKVTMSCCPFDGQPLVRSFDPYGFDGLWWRSDASPEEERPCPHFRVLLGAVNFAGAEPRSGDFEVSPGPEVPYIVPRILSLPGMVAVISSIQLDEGFTAYPIAYFSDAPTDQSQLTAGWVRSLHLFTNQAGRHQWRISSEAWDFDLGPWEEQGKLRWCAPDSKNLMINTETSIQCPYLDLPGERLPRVLGPGRSWNVEPPTGEPLLIHLG